MKPVVLVVENDLIISESIASDLINENYAVINQCESGEQAIRLVNELLPDLIIMDIDLKGEMNGIMAAEKILKRFNIPIIYLTGFKDTKTFQKAKVTSPANFLTKPFQSHQLLMAIELALFKGTVTANKDFGFFKTINKEALKVRYEDISFLNSDKVYCHVVLSSGKKFMISQPMNSVFKRIPSKNLVRVSKTYCVNKNHVDKLIGNMLFVGGEKITVGEKYRPVVKGLFNVI